MTNEQEFRPELTSRRGELMAWVSAVALGVAMFLAGRLWISIPSFLWIFEGFLAFSALSISLGNWMDRKSVIRLGAEGIAFENGLRSVRLNWSEVQNVAVSETRMGRRVQVIGPTSHFAFKMLNELNPNGQVFRTGFAAGQKILDTVVRSSGLQLKSTSDGLYYYSRT